VRKPARLALFDTSGTITQAELSDRGKAGGEAAAVTLGLVGLRARGKAGGEASAKAVGPAERRARAKAGGEATRDAGVGIHALSKEELAAAGKAGGEASHDAGVGCHALSKKELAAAGKAGGEATRDAGVGIYALPQAQRDENSRAGGHDMKRADFLAASLTPSPSAADRLERLLRRMQPLPAVNFYGSAARHTSGWMLCEETWRPELVAAAAPLRELFERGERTLGWVTTTALRGYGYVLMALFDPEYLVALVKRAVELTRDSAAHLRFGAAAAQLRKERQALQAPLQAMSVDESTGSCPAPPPSAGGAGTSGGGSPSDASSGVGPVGPNEADESDDDENGDDFPSGSSDCSSTISDTIVFVFETAMRCLEELKAAHSGGVAIRPVELQAAVLAHRALYSDRDTVTTACCTDNEFAYAFYALQAVGLELDGLLQRFEDNIKRARRRLTV
jgi:hypothetical protein